MAVLGNLNSINFHDRDDDFLPPLPEALERHIKLVKDGDTLGVQVKMNLLNRLVSEKEN